MLHAFVVGDRVILEGPDRDDDKGCQCCAGGEIEDIAAADPERITLQPLAKAGAGEIAAGNIQPATYGIGHPPAFLSPFAMPP